MLPVALATTQSAAHPPPDPDHGVTQSAHCALWAGDDDASNATALRNQTNESGLCALAAGTDIPLDTPPAAVERWNRGDLGEFPATNASRSVHPPDATLENGTFIKDAYAAVFAVQPSTRARLSPTAQPLYVAPEGQVLGTVDYRVAVPADESGDGRRVRWQLTDHEIVATRMLVDGAVVGTAPGSHTPTMSYSLGGAPGQAHTLTVEAEIAVELARRVEVCAGRDEAGSCADWNRSAEHRTETVTVRDSIQVVTYDLAVSGFYASYPNGDFGVVVYKNLPWLGYRLPGGDVRGVWRFYARRDTAWDTLVTRTADGRSVSHSPMHPLQVVAFPIEPGPTASPRRRVRIIESYGARTTPPTLGEQVHLDVISQPYTASSGIATRTRTTDHSLEAVRAYGLVRGVTANVTADSLIEVSIHRSDLSLTVLNATDRSVTVRVRLRDASTGDPINTVDREGYLVVQDRRVNTSDNGTVTLTMARPPGGVSARFEPGPWWHTHTGYVGDSDVVYVRGTVLAVLALVYRLAVPVSLFLLAVFLIDRITGWGVWPPWRGL